MFFREMQESQVEKSLWTHMVDGELMGVEPSLVKITPKWTALLLMLHAGLPNPW